MPEFGTPFVGLNAERKITRGELIRAIRYNIAAEFEAIQFYMQLYESIEDELARKVLLSIANEEKEHAGEFLCLLKYLNPDEEDFYNKGKKEVEEMIKNLGK